MALRASFWWKNKGGPGPFPGSVTELIHIARGIQMGHFCSLRKKSCTETKNVPMPSLFLWIRLQQRTTLLIVVNVSYQWPCSLLKSSNYCYLPRVKLKKTYALSGESSLKTLTAITKKAKTHSHHLMKMDPVQWWGLRIDQDQGWALGGSLGRQCCLSLDKGRGKAWRERERKGVPFLSPSPGSPGALLCAQISPFNTCHAG